MDESQSKADASPGGPAKTGNGKNSFWKRRPVVLAGTAVLAVLVLLALRYFSDSLTHEETDNAFLDADAVSIAPKVSGQVKNVSVAHDQFVKAGDLLVEIDPRDFEVLVAQKQAALAAAQSNTKVIKASFELLAAQVGTAEATAKQSEAEAAASQAAADKAAADLKRAGDLFERQAISPQEYDTAKAAATSATADLNAALQKAASDRSKIVAAKAQLEAGRAALARAEAQTDESAIDRQQAELNLSYTRLAAPQDGRVTRKAVEAGDFIQTGQKLMALVPTNLWVTANFKETQLKKIRVGQRVEVAIDSVAGRTFPARVNSIQAGSGAAFSLLPPENAVGNYVKVVQRVPVRIVFDAPPETDRVLGPGMSVVPSVRVSGFALPEFASALIAVAIAVAVGWFWWRAATRDSDKI